MRQCLREERAFGVVLIRHGREVAPGPAVSAEETSFHSVGTQAAIVDSGMRADGLLGIDTRGRQRFEISRHWRERSGLYMAEVRPLAAKVRVENLPDNTISRHRRVLERLIAADPARWPASQLRLDDPVWVAYRLSELLPIRLQERQEILAATCLDSALRSIDQLIESLGIS